MHGKDITIPKGTEMPCFVNANFQLDLLKFQQGASAAPAGQPRAARNASTPQTSASLNIEICLLSVPPETDIKLDRSLAGNTLAKISMSPGEHVITILLKGYKSWDRRIKAASDTVDIAADLEAEEKPDSKPNQ